ncbi:MAG: GNAT family N-acetyltransferase [Gemmatimonadetes bacterium]|nr:GNAT family N-acetyltransferase [Gemmatimonadota bacterium]
MPLTDVSITHLELSKSDFSSRKSNRQGVSFSHVKTPMPELNRFFYSAIGGQWFWLERRPWTLVQWAEYLANPEQLETWVLAVDGVPAGYVELDRKRDKVFEIAYLGLLSAFIGGGLGAHLLSCTCERAFELGGETILLNTCNLDHPKARANYEAGGFRAVRTEVKRKDVPTEPPGPWEGAHGRAE